MPRDFRDAPLITSRSNARVKELRAALRRTGNAQAGDLLALEGWHLLREAHRSGMHFDTVFIREGSEHELESVTPGSLRAAGEVRLSPEVFDSSVSTAAPQGVAATWTLQEPQLPATLTGTLLVLEDLQDPGNLGTLIRSADAFGATAVLVTLATASQWSPKAMRASAGSIFRQPVLRGSLSELGERLRRDGVRIFAAVRSFVGDDRLAAPHGVLTGRVDNADSPEPYAYRDGASEGAVPGYAASLSYDADFLSPCAVLIGNEGAGLSPEALSLADEQVQIPCSAESLNAAVAGSILLYEAMRQIPLRAWARKKGLRP